MSDRKRILITGASGLLGCHAVADLRERYEVHAIVRIIPELPLDGVAYHALDFSADWRTQDLPDAVDTIVHLAQSAHFREVPEHALDVFRVNVESTARLLDYAHRTGVKRFIYASSGGVYGSGDKAFDENSPIVHPDQLGYYLGSKLCGEVLVQNYAPFMNVLVLRFFFMYGTGQKRSMLIPRLIDSVRDGRRITLQGAEGIRINPIYVADAVVALSKAVSLAKSYTLNIGGPEVLSLRQIGILIGQAIQKEPVFEVTSSEPKDLIANIQAMEQELCSPKTLLCDGIKDLL